MSGQTALEELSCAVCRPELLQVCPAKNSLNCWIICSKMYFGRFLLLECNQLIERERRHPALTNEKRNGNLSERPRSRLSHKLENRRRRTIIHKDQLHQKMFHEFKESTEKVDLMIHQESRKFPITKAVCTRTRKKKCKSMILKYLLILTRSESVRYLEQFYRTVLKNKLMRGFHL